MSIPYEIAVRLLGSQNTHLNLRARAQLALRYLRQDNIPLPPDFIPKVRKAMYLRQNAVSYEQRNFPGWQQLPLELRDSLKAGYPLSGHGSAQMNTMLYLQRQADEAEAALVAAPVAQAAEAEVEQMIQDYLQWRATSHV